MPQVQPPSRLRSEASKRQMFRMLVEAGADVNATVPLKQYTGGCSSRVPLAHQPPAGQLAWQCKRVAMPERQRSQRALQAQPQPRRPGCGPPDALP